MSLKIFINSGNNQQFLRNWTKTLDILPDDTLVHILSTDIRIFQELCKRKSIKLAPIYSVLQNHSKITNHNGITQIDQTGNIINTSFCPNNPEINDLVRADFEILSETSQIAGIQLDGLSMPLQLPKFGCFCPYCHTLAEKRGIDLQQISSFFKEKANNGLTLSGITKQFPDWVKFRMDSVTNLAGRLMVILRQINPDLFLGLNVNFSNNPELLAIDYFFLALFLDNLNFIVNSNSHLAEKRLLKQIRSITKKFLGDIKVFLQIKVPKYFSPQKLDKLQAKLQRYSFDGLIFQVSAIEELNILANM